ncbi:unnamed protein product [Pleuronectes platessa]|uniref:Uncharacterized protein n=1 Tax=Pleuronectes platessa TaxID=8262 RepID=A0A9N7ZAH7_PLEPL|nr:unnamed protein product [Pleuronectes platessa]
MSLISLAPPRRPSPLPLPAHPVLRLGRQPSSYGKVRLIRPHVQYRLRGRAHDLVVVSGQADGAGPHRCHLVPAGSLPRLVALDAHTNSLGSLQSPPHLTGIHLRNVRGNHCKPTQTQREVSREELHPGKSEQQTWLES